MNIYDINPDGREAVKQFLLENHKQPEAQTTELALSGWIADAVDMAEFNDGQLIVEISASDSVKGQDATLLLDEGCYEVLKVLD